MKGHSNRDNHIFSGVVLNHDMISELFTAFHLVIPSEAFRERYYTCKSTLMGFTIKEMEDSTKLAVNIEKCQFIESSSSFIVNGN